MRHYITLFDKNYLAKGITLYKSLELHSLEEFRLWILPLDGESDTFLRCKKFKYVNMFSYKDLPKIVWDLKYTRPWNYFCFGLAPESMCWLMSYIQKDVTYLDADTYMFQDPKLCHDEIGQKSVGIVSHNFPPHDYNRLRPNGLYNVSWVTFKNDPEVKKVLWAWRDGVRNKCDAESCGDQLYLDQFPQLLGDKLHVFDGIRIGAGPWNAYTYSEDVLKSMIYYHYHEFKDNNGEIHLTGYPVTQLQKQYIYEPYIKEYNKSKEEIKEFTKC